MNKSKLVAAFIILVVFVLIVITYDSAAGVNWLMDMSSRREVTTLEIFERIMFAYGFPAYFFFTLILLALRLYHKKEQE